MHPKIQLVLISALFPHFIFFVLPVMFRFFLLCARNTLIDYLIWLFEIKFKKYRLFLKGYVIFWYDSVNINQIGPKTKQNKNQRLFSNFVAIMKELRLNYCMNNYNVFFVYLLSHLSCYKFYKTFQHIVYDII